MTSRLRLSPPVLCIAVVALAAALFSTTFDSAGPGMDEGILVAYPEFVLDGKVPGRDFETFYGPGQPYLVAGAFELTGPSVTTERVVGLMFRLAVLVGLFLLLLPWGRLVAVAGGLISTSLMLPLGVGAVSWFGGLAFALLGLGLLAELMRRDIARPRWPMSLAGLLSAGALAFRPDLAPAVVLSALPLLLALRRDALARYALGFALGLLPVVAWLATVGPDKLGKLLDDLQGSRAGRRLPLPSPLRSPWGQVLLASGLTSIGLLIAWAHRYRQGLSDLRTRLLLSLTLFSLAILPSALQRADDAHVLGVGCVSVALIPALLATAIGPLRRMRKASLARVITMVGLGAISLVGLVAIVHSGGPSAARAIGLKEPNESFDVVNAGRSFPLEAPGVARGLNALLPEVERVARPGDSLFVGPVDLRRTKYADTYLYFLLPDLAPASFYTELNPGTGNRAGSGLAGEIAMADLLLLTPFYDREEEPNASSELGSAEAAEVVRKEFCEVARGGGYRLYRHCRAAQTG